MSTTAPAPRKGRSSRSPALRKTPTGISGLDEITGGGLPAGAADAGVRQRRMRQDAAGHGIPRARRSGVRRAGRLHGLRGEGRGAGDELRLARVSTSTRWSRRRSWCRLRPRRAQRDRRRRASTTSKGCSSGWGMPSTASAPSAWCSTPSRRSSPGCQNTAILRAELRRLFRWLKAKGVTAIITGERGEKSLTRYGLEEYVADCVILLDHRVEGQMATRRLRIVKYRGSSHGTNEYPFLIDEGGISILPISVDGADATRRAPSACRRASRAWTR